MQLKTVRLHGGHGREDQSFLYRGYCYDSETGLYYIDSRYYDPNTVRFINADTCDLLTISLHKPNWDKNLFAYCDNDPVNCEDNGGQFWNFIVGGVISAASVYVGDVVDNLANGKKGWDILKPTSSVGTYVGASISGMIPGASIARIVTRSVVGTGVKYGMDSLILKRPPGFREVAIDLETNFVGKYLAKGANKALNKARPGNYSSFRHQIIRRMPSLTQRQTKQYMYTTNKVIGAAIMGMEIMIAAVTSR